MTQSQALVKASDLTLTKKLINLRIKPVKNQYPATIIFIAAVVILSWIKKKPLSRSRVQPLHLVVACH